MSCVVAVLKASVSLLAVLKAVLALEALAAVLVLAVLAAVVVAVLALVVSIRMKLSLVVAMALRGFGRFPRPSQNMKPSHPGSWDTCTWHWGVGAEEGASI